MKAGGGRGLKAPQWYSNEMLHNDDINALHEFTYQNTTDMWAYIAKSDQYGTDPADTVISGLDLEHSAAMTCNLRPGIAASFTGYYFDNGIWGWHVSAGDVFSIEVGDSASVAFDVGGTQDRIDVLEVRPIRIDYRNKSRQFKDPVTGGITSVLVDTRIEYGFEFHIIKGTEGATPSAPSSTVGWIKLAEVYVAGSATSIDQDDILDVRDSDSWTTETSKTVLLNLVEVDAGDVLIADAGNRYTGVDVETALQEIAGAGRTTETVKQNQDDIDALETDLYSKHEADGDHKADIINDLHIDWGVGANQVSAIDLLITDVGTRFTGTEVETALQELAGDGRTVETVKQNQDDIDTLETSVGALETDLYNKHESNGDHKDNVIDDTHIDWGTGANQVSAVDMLITDTGGYFTSTEVEGALQELGAASGFSGDHADLTNVTSDQHHAQSHNHDADYLGLTDKAADSSKLNNAVESVAAGNNTIVKRHSSGYIFANYFNTTPNDVTSGITKILVETGNDGYMRHGTIAALRIFHALAADHGAAATDQIINVCYGTGSPPAANTTTIGTLFVKYTP